jgi:hypothetical protein
MTTKKPTTMTTNDGEARPNGALLGHPEIRDVRQPEQKPVVQTRLLLTRLETMRWLGFKSSHFSKIVSGGIKGLPRLPVVQIGRKQFFRPEAVEKWIIEVERMKCKAAH